MNKLKVLDLFSGIAGFSLGLERTGGFETIAFCEQDEHCQKVLKKHWSEVKIFKDVSNLKYKGGYLHSKDRDWDGVWGEIDVVCGGFPCQDISVAGQKKGLKGERSGLWSEFKRIIKEVKPRYAIIENVANLRNLGLTEVIKDLGEIGYVCEWHIISARSVGAVHLRERIWIIAYPDSEAIREQPRRSSGQSGKEKNVIRKSSKKRNVDSTYSHMPRLWKPFATEEEKSQWWSEATSSFRDRWKTKPPVCGVDDGIPERPHEGNSNIGMEQSRIDTLNDLISRNRVTANLETGEIISLVTGKVLKGCDLKGYITHKLVDGSNKYSFKAHQIVMAVAGELCTGKIIDHINRNKKDNRVINLRMVDAKTNYINQDRSHIGLSEEEKYEIAEIYAHTKITIRELAEETGISKSRVHQVIKEVKLDKIRRERIKQLGNAVVPAIPQLIGQAILDWEKENGRI